MKILFVLFFTLVGMSVANLPGALLAAFLSSVLYNKVLKDKIE